MNPDYSALNWRHNTYSGIDHRIRSEKSPLTICGEYIGPNFAPIQRPGPRPCQRCIWSMEVSHVAQQKAYDAYVADRS